MLHSVINEYVNVNYVSKKTDRHIVIYEPLQHKEYVVKGSLSGDIYSNGKRASFHSAKSGLIMLDGDVPIGLFNYKTGVIRMFAQIEHELEQEDEDSEQFLCVFYEYEEKEQFVDWLKGGF